MTNNMKSDILKNRIETLPHRALLRSAGLQDEDFQKPFIGVADAYNDLIPGHIHLRELSKEVKRGIKDAGGVPFEWGVPGICDGIAMHVEMRLSLPSREHIADNIELMMLSHSLDGWVGVTNCDKITPGMLMAAGRLDLPAIMLTGGPMKANRVNDERMDPIRNFGIVGEVKAGKMTEAEAEEFAKCTVCGAGSCCGLYTANTMACVTEALGMSLPHCAATLAVSKEKKKQAYESGRRIVELVRQDIKPSQIMTKDAFENAVRVDMALGGSTNTTLHIPAIAKELDIEIPLQMFDDISRETPNICHFKPSGKYAVEELEVAGGISAVLKRLKSLIKNNQTVSGKTIFELADEAQVLNEEIIRPIDNPYYQEGGIAVLRGNIAESSVIKQTAVHEDMMAHSGPAKVFWGEDDLLKAIEDKKIEEGDVVVLNFLGPAGAPGMPEMLTPTDAIKGAGFKKVALITDGRFSGGTSGPCIGHIEPEAYLGGNIGVIKDGDIIEINIPERSLNVKLSDEEIEARKKKVKAPEREMSPMMKRYRRMIETGC
jgi:dihydroxy-acid dehydratase